MLNPVQNCLNFQLHGWSLGSCCSVAAEHHWITRRPVFFYPHRAILRDGSENRALQECNPSAEPSMDCNDCIPPGSGKLPGRALALRMPLQAMVKAKNSSFPLGPQAAILNFLPTNSATDPQMLWWLSQFLCALCAFLCQRRYRHESGRASAKVAARQYSK